MADLSDRLYRAFTRGRRSPAGEAVSLPRRMAELERAHGSKTAAAKAAGVTLRTWERWTTGQHKPKAASLGSLRAAQRAVRTPRAEVQRFRQASTITIEGTSRYDRKGNSARKRDITLSSMHLQHGWAGRVADAWEAGQDPGAALRAELLDSAGFYADLFDPAKQDGEFGFDVDAVKFT